MRMNAFVRVYSSCSGPATGLVAGPDLVGDWVNIAKPAGRAKMEVVRRMMNLNHVDRSSVLGARD